MFPRFLVGNTIRYFYWRPYLCNLSVYCRFSETLRDLFKALIWCLDFDFLVYEGANVVTPAPERARNAWC